MGQNAANRIPFAGRGFQATPTRSSLNLSPMSAFTPGYLPEASTSTPSKRTFPEAETPTKRIKPQQAFDGLQLPQDKRSVFRPLGFEIPGAPVAGPSTPRKKYSLVRPPFPVKLEDELEPERKRLSLGGILPDQLSGLDKHHNSELEHAANTEDPLYDSDDQADRKPCRPRMSDLPSLSLQASRLAAKQKSSAMLFRANIPQSRSTKPSLGSRGALQPLSAKTPDISSATYCLQIVAVASHCGPNPIFTARSVLKNGRTEEMYLILSIDDTSQDRSTSITPAVVATTLPQGETRTILAHLWDPVQKLLLDHRDVWLSSRYILAVI